MTQFIVQDSLRVLTQNGECRIDLCLGDITKLRRQDKVDVIMISAFRGDYSPTPTSVIGALKRNLQINVRNLARDKEEDLRNLYQCWWSKPLPDEAPYKRLLCFETKNFGMGRPEELVANVYRCLVPILNNEDGTVITPLLNTGDQGYGKVSMLQGMVVAAVNWMKAGLPLRLLKIVLYARITDGMVSESTMREYQGVCDRFAELKERYDSQYLVPKAVNIEFDIYLSYSEDDKGVVESIQERLKAAKSDIRIFGDKQVLDSESVWQQDMYQVMRRSSRVVTVLSPHYLKSTECIEQYNIALCCNRRAHRDMLAPFYVDSVQLMPTYMGLVQYVDCRPNDDTKIHKACTNLLLSITATVHLETMVVDPAPIQYDIFLSYSHRDDKKANLIVKMLQKLAPNLRVFFDIQELKTGKAWQRTLYHSIDGSRCLLALISKSYIRSSVCQEEYNLALAKHCSGDGSLQLIPLCIEELTEKVPATFSKVKMTNATPDVFDTVTSAVCKAVVSWLNGGEVDANVEGILTPDKSLSCSMDKVSEDKRLADFTTKYGTAEKKLVCIDDHFPAKLQKVLTRAKSEIVKAGEVADIVLSYAKEDYKYASFLQAAIKTAAPKIVVKATTKSEKERLTLMESARRVVAFLSPNYLDSPEQVEEFNIALCRERVSSTTVLFPITLHALPQQPAYIHIVPTAVNITDAMWAKLASKWNVHVPMLDIFDMPGLRSEGVYLPPEVALGLHEAACVLIAQLKCENESNALPTPRPVLHNILKIQDDLKTDGSTDEGAGVELAKMLITLSLSSDESIKDILGDEETTPATETEVIAAETEVVATETEVVASESEVVAIETVVNHAETGIDNTETVESKDADFQDDVELLTQNDGDEEASPSKADQTQEHGSQSPVKDSHNGEIKRTPETTNLVSEQNDTQDTRPGSQGDTCSHDNQEAHGTEEHVNTEDNTTANKVENEITTTEQERQRRPKSAACGLL